MNIKTSIRGENRKKIKCVCVCVCAGVLGSALADEDMIKDLIPWLNHKQSTSHSHVSLPLTDSFYLVF